MRTPFALRAALALAAAAAAAGAAGCKRDHTVEALARVRSGDTALDSGDVDGAMAHYRAAVKLRDDLPPAWVGLGKGYASYAVAAARAAELDKSRAFAGQAADAFRKAIRLDADSVDGYAGLGAAYGFLGEPEHAYPVFLRLTEIRPHDPRAHEALAIALTDLGRFAEAIPHFERAIEAFPDDAMLFLKLGKALVGIDHPSEALPILMRFHEIAPDDPRYLEGVGEAFLAAGAPSEALEAYRRLEDAGAGHKLDALSGEGTSLLMMGDAAAAEERFRAGLAILERLGVGPDAEALHSREVRNTVAGFHYGLGRALAVAKRESDAVEALRDAIAVDAGHIPAMTLLGGLLTGLKRYDEAIAVLEKLVKKAPWSEVAATLHADVLAMDKKYGQAAAEYERSVRLSPDNPTLLNNYAWMLVTAEEPKFVNCPRAVELAERAVLLSDYRNAPALDTLAEAYHCVGRPKDALRIVEMAIHVTPDDEMLYGRRAKYEAALAGKR